MTYFETEGKENIDRTLELVKRTAEERGIMKIVVASSSSFTVEKAFEILKDLGVTLTIVSTDRGRFSSHIQQKLEENGHNVCFSRKVSIDYPDSIALAFRRFS